MCPQAGCWFVPTLIIIATRNYIAGTSSQQDLMRRWRILEHIDGDIQDITGPRRVVLCMQPTKHHVNMLWVVIYMKPTKKNVTNVELTKVFPVYRPRITDALGNNYLILSLQNITSICCAVDVVHDMYLHKIGNQYNVTRYMYDVLNMDVMKSHSRYCDIGKMGKITACEV